MSKLTDAQLAEIAARHEQERQWSREKHAEVSPGEPYSESGWCPMDMSLADVSALLNQIAAVTAELAAANARADGERAKAVAWLRARRGEWIKGSDARAAAGHFADAAQFLQRASAYDHAADAIERGEHEQD